MTISLDDVWSLIHLPIIEEFCPTEPLEYEDSIETLMTLVGVDRVVASNELNHCRGGQVRLSWLRDLYNNCCETSFGSLLHEHIFCTLLGAPYMLIRAPLLFGSITCRCLQISLHVVDMLGELLLLSTFMNN